MASKPEAAAADPVAAASEITLSPTGQITATDVQAGFDQLATDATLGYVTLGTSQTITAFKRFDAGIGAVQAGTTAAGTPLRVATWTPAPAGKAPFTIEIGGAEFGGVEDPVLYFGYNMRSGGNRVDTSEPRIGLCFEGDYLDGSVRTVETYLEYQDPSGAFITRPLMFQFRRDPANVNATIRQSILRGNPIQFQLPDQATVLAQFSDGQAVFNGSQGAILRIASGTGAPVIIGQQGNTNYWQIGGWNRNVTTFSVDGRTVLQMDSFATYQGIGLGGNAGRGGIMSNISGMTATGLVAFQSKLPASPLANSDHQTWENGNVIQSRVDRNGYFMTRRSTAPANSDLVNGEVGLWFDKTAGVGRPVMKGKDAAGAVTVSTLPGMERNNTWTGVQLLNGPNLGIRSSDFGSGTGVIAVGDAAVSPPGTPAGGFLHWAQLGNPVWRRSDGSVLDLKRHPAVATPTGGAVVDEEARAAIASLIARLAAAGITA